jgi:UDP-N-acetyl-D-mannosaminuronic acid dehydrogenase
VGLGRVGLPTAALAAAAGHRVTGVDRDAAVRAGVARGTSGAREPGLESLLRRALAGGLAVADAPVAADVTVICVPTPLGPRSSSGGSPSDPRPALDELWAAVAAIDEVAPADGLVVVASTVPVGATEEVAARLRTRHVACCPERVLPGDAVREMTENPRIVGGVGDEATARAAAWLATWVRGPIDQTDARTAELAKLMENAARDVEIALANTIAAAAGAVGVDPTRLRALVSRHPRIRLLDPGIGVGGHCLPVDPWFAIAAAPAETTLLRAARAVNDATPDLWVARIEAEAERIGARRIGLLGLTYKPESDDLRDAPAVRIARALAARFDVVAADPYVERVEGVAVRSVHEVVHSDLVVLLVAHRALVDVDVPAGRTTIDACGGWR